MENTINREILFTLIATILVAVFGASAKEISKLEDRPFNLKSFLCNVGIAIFAGLLVGLLGSALGFDTRLVAAVSGIAGYLGVNSIEILARLLQRKALPGVTDVDVISAANEADKKKSTTRTKKVK